MKIHRTKNAVRNIKYGVFLKIYQIVTPFLIRTMMIYYLGIEYLGLNSLFTSILSVLNMAELGVGGAMVFSMYKPIAEDDTSTICALMNLYKRYYRIIGGVVLSSGLVIMPFISKLISGEVPANVNIYILFALSLLSTVLSYWLFAYKTCLFSAHQRGDITSKINLFICTLTYIAQFIALVLFRNYYIYLGVNILFQIVQNIISAKIASKMYPVYKARGFLSQQEINNINQRVKDLFTAKIGSVVLNSADTIVISAFLGIVILGKYNNYYYIMTSVIGFTEILFYAATAGIGNSIVVESKEKNFNDFKIMTVIIMWISAVCVSCFLNLYQPFMYIWMSGKTEMMLPFEIVICLCIYFWTYEVNRVANVYKDAAGIWHEDRFRPLVTALCNLLMNLFMVRYIGLFGVLLSTVFSTVIINCPWLYFNLFKTIFEKKNFETYLKLIIKYLFVTVLIAVITYVLCSAIPAKGLLALAAKLIICMSIPNAVLYMTFRKDDAFVSAQQLIIRSVKR